MLIHAAGADPANNFRGGPKIWWSSLITGLQSWAVASY